LENSDYLSKGPCSACGSRDAAALYTDGHIHCFSCGHHTGPSDQTPTKKQEARTSSTAAFIEGDYQPLTKRGITAETCRKMGYKVGIDKHGSTVQIADYRDADGHLVGQKLRGKDKAFSAIGMKDAPLFAQHVWASKGKRVVVTEGEIDALSVAQVTGLSWPVVSVPSGAQGAAKSLSAQIAWLEGYEEVVLMFDMDEAGRKAAAECAQLFTPGRCKIAELPRKDANEMLTHGDVKALTTAIYNARTYRPDGIVTLADVRDKILAPIEAGIPYLFPGVTEATYGRERGQLIGIGAGSGVGKTDLVTQMVETDITQLGLKVGILFLEQPVEQTGKRLAGKFAGKRFHIPDGSWTQEELETALDTVAQEDRLYLYDSFGGATWAVIRGRIKYMVQHLGCESIYLDHLTALTAHMGDERQELEAMLEEMATMAKTLNFVFHFISHLATPKDGPPHEEGGRVKGQHFKGSRTIMFWAHMLWGLERNTQADDPEERKTSILRCLKDRHTGRATGMTFPLTFDDATGRLIEGEREEPAFPFQEDDGAPF